MMTEWGMNDRLGFVYYGEDDNKPGFFDMGGGKEYSEDTQRLIDEEVKKLIDALYEETRGILEANREKIDAVARALIKYETLDADDIDRIMRGDKLTKPTVSDLLSQEKDRTPQRQTVIAPAPTPDGPDVSLGGGPLPTPG